MRVFNETNWRTDQLKKLAMEVAKRESSLSTEGRKNLKIEFGSRPSRVWPRSYLSGSKVRIKVPRPLVEYEPMGFECRVGITQILTWAIGIWVGLRGKDMNGLSKYCFGSGLDRNGNISSWDWVQEFPVGQKEPKAKKEVTAEMMATTERMRTTYEVRQTQKKLDYWNRRMMLSMTMVRKLQGVLKRAEKKLAEVQTTLILEPEGKPMNSRKFRKPESEVTMV